MKKCDSKIQKKIKKRQNVDKVKYRTMLFVAKCLVVGGNHCSNDSISFRYHTTAAWFY